MTSDQSTAGIHRRPAEAAQVCLQASHLLRRHTRGQLTLPHHDQRTADATCRLLEAISLALTDDPDCLPRPVTGAALRLAGHIAELSPRTTAAAGLDAGARR